MSKVRTIVEHVYHLIYMASSSGNIGWLVCKGRNAAGGHISADLNGWYHICTLRCPLSNQTFITTGTNYILRHDEKVEMANVPYDENVGASKSRICRAQNGAEQRRTPARDPNYQACSMGDAYLAVSMIGTQDVSWVLIIMHLENEH